MKIDLKEYPLGVISGRKALLAYIIGNMLYRLTYVTNTYNDGPGWSIRRRTWVWYLMAPAVIPVMSVVCACFMTFICVMNYFNDIHGWRHPVVLKGDLMDPLHTKAECFTYLLRTLIKPFRFYDEQ